MFRLAIACHVLWWLGLPFLQWIPETLWSLHLALVPLALLLLVLGWLELLLWWILGGPRISAP